MEFRRAALVLAAGWLCPGGGLAPPPAAMADDEAGWALRPLVRPEVPVENGAGGGNGRPWARTPIDHFIAAKLAEHGLRPSPEADRRALIRRAAFDLTGLPPTPREVAAFVADDRADAYERLVGRLLASPRYGERWARHWMDVVHYAETHGHDEDVIRPNAWPYRDYLIQSFNEDKPYARFVREQVAGDVLFPEDPRAIVATGFLAAGPWDESSQMGIVDGTKDKKIAQYLDRDDMLSTTMSTFTSLTVHCARCHDHKFDPISTADYYALQAVFAGVDRVERPYDANPGTRLRRAALASELKTLEDGTPLSPDAIAETESQPDFRAWEAIAANQAELWTVLKPESCRSSGGATARILADSSVLFGGVRPDKDTYTIRAQTDLANVTAVRLEVLADASLPQRGPGRQDNGNLHLTEMRLAAAPTAASGCEDKPPASQSVPLERAVADFNQAGWEIDRALDGRADTAWGIYPAVGKNHEAVFTLKEPLKSHGGDAGFVLSFRLDQIHGGGHLIGRLRLSVTDRPDSRIMEPLSDDISAALRTPGAQRGAEERELLVRFHRLRINRLAFASLPESSRVYAVATDFQAKGNFHPAHGPRDVFVLERGDIDSPASPARPGTLSCVAGLKSRFELKDPGDEGERRAALADRLAHPENVLTWRSITNRVWHYHFGRGIAGTPSDFGAMGQAPTHPELLDWLAHGFREHGGSVKWLHTIIMNSAVYRQSSRSNPDFARIDTDNRFLWRMHRPRLDAESLRDAVLQISGSIDLTMGGPSARMFNESKGVHETPALDYLGFNPDAPANFRRSVYRFVFRTVPDPFMQALDCPDASQLTPSRSVSFNALQALAMRNNRFIIRQCDRLATRLKKERGAVLRDQVSGLFQLAYQRNPRADESSAVTAYARDHGLANACRVILNSNEFIFID